MFQAPIGPEPSEITCKVGPHGVALGLGQEHCTRKFWAAPIAQGEIVTAHGNFSYLVNTDVCTVLIEYEDFHVLHGIAGWRNIPDKGGLCVYAVVAKSKGFRGTKSKV